MTQYELTPERRRGAWRVLDRGGRSRGRGGVGTGGARGQVSARSVDELLAAARRRIDRVEPAQLETLYAEGALVVDIRPEHQRAEEGELGFGLVVERNVLEWRFDPPAAMPCPR